MPQPSRKDLPKSTAATLLALTPLKKTLKPYTPSKMGSQQVFAGAFGLKDEDAGFRALGG